MNLWNIPILLSVTRQLDHKNQKFLTLLWKVKLAFRPRVTTGTHPFYLSEVIVSIWLLLAYVTRVRSRSGASALSQGCCSPLRLFLVASDDLWPHFVTYTDNMSGMKARPLHDLIWRAYPRDIERALFGDVSSFLPVRDIFPNSHRAASLLCVGPVTFPPPRAVPLD